MRKRRTLFISVKGKSKIFNKEKVTLHDGRNVQVQHWKDGEYSFITYFFQMEGLENKSKEELYMYLRDQGLELRVPFSKGAITLQKFYNEEKQLCWGLTVIVGKILGK
ncbi:hypothetical protein DS745_01605 [Anaerobacillus alkaliphilus]|uniref:Uncharacterized protein n=1 Tax=Anaerobacillus alkaliphilus TaxID=1548597 RepID=A0A4Q0VWK6_9BACI|nr:hypothetical protein [Anaerobacillus alkaliphilus]RXJ04107.1 hypothetical protein DS745_01605 [Anaerobacillus alkaliphilus]